MLLRKPVIATFLLLFFCSSPAFLSTTSLAAGDTLSSSPAVGKRNIFRPLWNTAPAEKAPPAKTPVKRTATDIQREEQAKREAEKKELAAQFTFSGIILEHNEEQAVLLDKKTGKSYVARKGDMIEGMEVLSIDSSNGEIILNHKELSAISLHLQ